MSFERRYKPLKRDVFETNSLEDIGDVTITSLSNGDLIRFNGSIWVNVPPTDFEDELTILESQITDGSILARVADNETVTGTWQFASDLRIRNTNPHIYMEGTAFTADQNNWLFDLDDGSFRLYAVNDAKNAFETVLYVNRTGAGTINEVELNAALLDFNGAADFNSTVQVNGTLSVRDGTAAAPGVIFFNDPNTGLFRGGIDILGIAVGGAEVSRFSAAEIEFNATLFDFNGNADISGTLSFGGGIWSQSGAILTGGSTTGARLYLSDTDAGTNAKTWGLVAFTDESFIISPITDAGGIGTAAIQIFRGTEAGTASEIEFDATLFDFNGACDISGALTTHGATYVQGGSNFRVYDAAGTDYIQLSHDGASAILQATNTDRLEVDMSLQILGGFAFRCYDSLDTDYIALGHNGAGGSVTTSAAGLYLVPDSGQIFLASDTIGHFEAVSGNFGSVQADGAEGSSGSWNGYSIGGRLVFMDNAGTSTTNRGGIYDDLNNTWIVQFNTDASTRYLSLYAAGVEALRVMDYTTSDFGTGAMTRDGLNTFQPVGFNVIPVYEVDVDDSFDLAHNGMMWHNDAGGTDTFTCANDATIPVGATYIITHEEASTLTIAQGSGVTIRWFAGTGAPATGNRTLAHGGVATVYKYTDTEFWIWGIGVA